MPGYDKDTEMVGLFEKQKAAKSRAVDCMISEIFSPPRIVPRAVREGMEKGFSIDVEATDPFIGRRWGLSQVSQQRQVMKLIATHKPYMVTLSPPCTMCSPLSEPEQKEG